MSKLQRDREDESKKHVLAPGTPSPHKRRRVEDAEEPVVPSINVRRPELPISHVPAASTLLSKVTKQGSELVSNPINFESSNARTARDNETLRLMETLEMGPYEHTPPSTDPEFKEMEPHSRIRMEQRMLSHEDVCELMTGRYFLSPTLVYSVARPSKSRQEYEVPVDGEWVTIAVVAERGDVKVSQRGASTNEDDDEDEKRVPGTTVRKTGPKKYMTIRLVDLGSAPSEGKGNALRGDSQLNMILFEADQVTTSRAESEKRVERTYKGGSGGAFEHSSTFVEGTVIAVCSPKVLRPYQTGQGSNASPNSITNLIGITPTSLSSITVIGKSRDLGHCTAARKDGKPCGNWCDKRVSTACDWHLQQAVQSRRAGRAEFSVGTSGMFQQGAGRGSRANKFDPSQRKGLLPVGAQAVPDSSRSLSGDTGAMYVIGADLVRSTRGEKKDDFISEHIGREKQEKSERKRKREEGEYLLSQLFTRSGDQQVAESEPSFGSSKQLMPLPKKKAFSAEAIKLIGFDPTTVNQNIGKQKASEADVKQKMYLLENLQKPERKFMLGKRPSMKKVIENRNREQQRSPSPPPTTEGDDDSELEIED